MREIKATEGAARVSGVVLAGGLGRRMGHMDKGLLECAGRPLVAYVIARLQPQVGPLFINANRNQQRYADFGYPLLADSWPDFPGPLAGIAVALQAASTEFVVTAPCDSPLLQSDYVTRLLQAADRDAADIACAYGAGRVQPVFALIRRCLLAKLEDYLAAGNRKLEHWYRSQLLTIVDFSCCPDMFININTPAELAAVAQHLEHESNENSKLH